MIERQRIQSNKFNEARWTERLKKVAKHGLESGPDKDR